MTEFEWPTGDDVHEMAKHVLEDDYLGVRDKGLLDAAVGATQAQHYYGGVDDPFDLAAHLAHNIQRQQALVEGNKRTGTATGIHFLSQVEPRAHELHGDDYSHIVEGFAMGTHTPEDLADHWRKLLGKKEAAVWLSGDSQLSQELNRKLAHYRTVPMNPTPNALGRKVQACKSLQAQIKKVLANFSPEYSNGWQTIGELEAIHAELEADKLAATDLLESVRQEDLQYLRPIGDNQSFMLHFSRLFDDDYTDSYENVLEAGREDLMVLASHMHSDQILTNEQKEMLIQHVAAELADEASAFADPDAPTNEVKLVADQEGEDLIPGDLVSDQEGHTGKVVEVHPSDPEVLVQWDGYAKPEWLDSARLMKQAVQDTPEYYKAEGAPGTPHMWPGDEEQAQAARDELHKAFEGREDLQSMLPEPQHMLRCDDCGSTWKDFKDETHTGHDCKRCGKQLTRLKRSASHDLTPHVVGILEGYMDGGPSDHHWDHIAEAYDRDPDGTTDHVYNMGDEFAAAVAEKAVEYNYHGMAEELHHPTGGLSALQEHFSEDEINDAIQRHSSFKIARLPWEHRYQVGDKVELPDGGYGTVRKQKYGPLQALDYEVENEWGETEEHPEMNLSRPKNFSGSPLDDPYGWKDEDYHDARGEDHTGLCDNCGEPILDNHEPMEVVDGEQHKLIHSECQKPHQKMASQQQEISKGFPVEMEHWDTVDRNPHTVVEIVKDHLEEDPNYYDKLEKVHKEAVQWDDEEYRKAEMFDGGTVPDKKHQQHLPEDHAERVHFNVHPDGMDEVRWKADVLRGSPELQSSYNLSEGDAHDIYDRLVEAHEDWKKGMGSENAINVRMHPDHAFALAEELHNHADNIEGDPAAKHVRKAAEDIETIVHDHVNKIEGWGKYKKDSAFDGLPDSYDAWRTRGPDYDEHDCPDCKGSGEDEYGDDGKCHFCEGQGVVSGSAIDERARDDAADAAYEAHRDDRDFGREARTAFSTEESYTEQVAERVDDARKVKDAHIQAGESYVDFGELAKGASGGKQRRPFSENGIMRRVASPINPEYEKMEGHPDFEWPAYAGIPKVEHQRLETNPPSMHGRGPEHPEDVAWSHRSPNAKYVGKPRLSDFLNSQFGESEPGIMNWENQDWQERNRKLELPRFDEIEPHVEPLDHDSLHEATQFVIAGTHPDRDGYGRSKKQQEWYRDPANKGAGRAPEDPSVPQTTYIGPYSKEEVAAGGYQIHALKPGTEHEDYGGVDHIGETNTIVPHEFSGIPLDSNDIGLRLGEHYNEDDHTRIV